MKSYAQRMKKPQIANLQQTPAVGVQIGNQAMGALVGYDASKSKSDPALEDKMRAKLQKQFSFPNQEAHREPGGVPLPPAIQNEYEEKSGVPLDDVRVHYNSKKPSGFQANAFTYGSDIYLGAGNQECIGHEIGHVVQQKKGKVVPTHFEQGFPVNSKPELERTVLPAYKSKNLDHAQSVPPVIQFNRDGQPMSEADRGRIILEYVNKCYPSPLKSKSPRTLLLGEENFLFTKALVAKHPKIAKNLYATRYRSLSPRTTQIRSLQRKLGAGHVLGSVDATNIQATPKLQRLSFDRVYFNYPRAIAHRSTKKLIDQYAKSARKVLKYGGQLRISVPTKATYAHLVKGNSRDSWQKHIHYGRHIKRRIERLGFLFIEQKEDLRKRYGEYGYERRMNDSDKGLDRLKGKELVFVKVPYMVANELSKEAYHKQFGFETKL